MAVTDEAGIIYYRFVYDTYGELSDITTDDGVSLKSSEQLTEYRLAELSNATGIDYLYNGQYGVETDSNGLYYMRARYYNQDIKRFINRDVVSGDISNSQSLNRYCYVQGNPVSLTDPFGLCPDPNSNFKNFCKFLYYTDWSAIGHAALDVAGLFWDGADVINMFWYMAEKKWDQAAECAIYALPVMGSFAGSLLMKGNKASKFGSALKTVSQLTQGSIGICCGVDMTITGITNIMNSIDSGTINPEDILMTIGGITATSIWGKSVLPSGGIKRITNSISDAYKTKKADRLSELGKQGRVIDADISHAPVGGVRKTPAQRAAEKGYKGIGTTPNGGADFAGSGYVYIGSDGKEAIVKIKMTGSRSRDFTQAFNEAGIPKNIRKGIKENYTWHHLDDFNPETGECTMQLVRSDAHVATYPHKGSVSQYEKYHNTKYK